VIKALNYLFDAIIINKDPGGIVDLAFHPYLHPPLVAVKPEAFPLVMEEAVTCLKIGFLIYAADHCLEFLGEEDIILLAETFQLYEQTWERPQYINETPALTNTSKRYAHLAKNIIYEGIQWEMVNLQPEHASAMPTDADGAM
jgi:hypothetical protein